MTPGQLVKAVSIALQVPEETVVVHDRNLVVAGLRTKSGRGPSAAKVTPHDAARLLVATLGSARSKDSVQTVREFETAVFRSDPFGFPPANIEHPALAELPDGHNFIEALTSLIKAASAPLSADEADQLLKLMGVLEIQCSTPSVRGVIMLADSSELENSYNSPHDLSASKQTVSASTEKRREQEMQQYGRLLHTPGIGQIRWMHGNVILMIGLAFRENGLNYPTADKAIDAIVASYSKAAKTKKNKVA